MKDFIKIFRAVIYCGCSLNIIMSKAQNTFRKGLPTNYLNRTNSLKAPRLSRLKIFSQSGFIVF